MKTSLMATAALLLAAPLGAQVLVETEGITDPSTLGNTVVLNAEAIGDRVARSITVTFQEGPLTLRTIRVVGSSEFTYELDSLSRLPAVIRGDLKAELFVIYQPRTPGPARATLEFTVRLDDVPEGEPQDRLYTIPLLGQVPDLTLAYSVPGRPRRTVPPEGQVEFGNRPINVATEATVLLTNTGSAPATIRGVSIAGGAGFEIVSPPGYPVILEPGSSLNLQVAFTPGATGNYRSTLQIDGGVLQARYFLTGIGGDELSYSLLRYPPGSNTAIQSPIRSGVPIVFGQSAKTVELIGTNAGQTNVLIEQIRVSGPFTVTGIPPVPTSLGPGGTIRLAIEPRVPTGGATVGELVIDDAVFPLELDLPPLRNVSFTTLGRVLRPGEQVGVGLTIPVPYPVDIRGTLDLELDSLETTNDPALQWAAGGRTVNFRIPAGQTAAVFASNSREAQFQASTVSGTVRVLASFAAEAWGIDITPAAQPTLEFTVRLQALPAVRFSRQAGPVIAGEPVELGLYLASPYPEAVSGVLSLVFEPADLDGAPGAWQNRRQVGFTIPAGSTTAMFGGGTASSTTFAAPAASGGLTITASFQTEAAGADLTPDPAPELKLTVTKASLPDVTFSREGGSVRAGESVSLGLSLASTYSEDLIGSLRLSFAAADVDGASGPWAGAGRQVAFRIPAGSLQAEFGGQGNRSTQFAMPSSEGRVTVTASFQTEAGGADVTPDPAPELAFDVGIAALSGVSFTMRSGEVAAGSSVALGLSLAQPYSETLAGTLSMAFAAADVDGASGPWAGAGRQVAFRIPAGSTAAEFGGAGNLTTEFTAPSSEGRLTVTARLQTEDGGADVTPDPMPEVSFDVTVAALPAVSFSSEGGPREAGSAMELGLSLAGPYRETLEGTLSMAFAAADVDGASGPWAGAGRQVAFRIPAGTTAAEFGGAGNLATEFALPSAAGRLTVTARLQTEAGVDVTPDPAPEVAFSVEVSALPEVTFSRDGGALMPGASVELGLSLAAPYGQDLAGTLSMAFAAADVDGASGPWAGAGRQVAFRIPAGSTAAEFGGAGNLATEFSAPAAAGRITVTARFRTEDGGADVTPDPAPELSFTIEVSALPEVMFSRSAGTVMPGATMDLGLSLAEPYAAAVSGTLVLAFAPSDAGASAGAGWTGAGRQVPFRIGAGETQAMFGAGGAVTEFRTPLVAGLLTATARFETDEGGVDITPSPQPELELTVEAAALPAITFSHTGGTVDAADQVEMEVTLAEPYSTDIVGNLSLLFETRAFANDPSIQWATGGRLAWFTIPAGSRLAIYTGLSSTNAFQTGTVAGEIVMRAQFFAVPDGIARTRIELAAASAADITPDVIPEIRFGVMESAPVLRSVALGQTGQGGFSLQVTGYATSRMVDSIAFSFTGAQGTALSTKELVADVGDAMRTFFGGNQSAATGGNFMATISFSMDEGVFEDLASVSVTASNPQGVSNTVSLSLND